MLSHATSLPDAFGIYSYILPGGPAALSSIAGRIGMDITQGGAAALVPGSYELTHINWALPYREIVGMAPILGPLDITLDTVLACYDGIPLPLPQTTLSSPTVFNTALYDTIVKTTSQAQG